MILDAPPVLATTEPIMLAHIVDQVLMVVEADRTAHSAIKSALDLLEPCDNVSLILNKAVGSKSTEQFGSYYAPYLRGKPAGSPGSTQREGIMRRVSQRRRALLPAAALLAFAEAITPANAANIHVEKNAGFDVTLTDNLNLEPDDKADSALILSPFVGFNARGDGDRVDFAFNYRLTMDTILSKDSDVNIRNDFIGFGKAELIDDMLFIDVTGSASQPLIDPGGRTSTSPSVGRSSRTQVAAGSISPYLLNHFGDVAETELRYRYSYTFVGSDQIGDSSTNYGLARLSTGRLFTAVRLDAIAEAERTNSESATGDIDRTTFRLDGQYPIMRQFSLLGSVGYETIDTNSLNDDPDGPLWYVGFFTRPGPKTELRLTYGERYGEPDINGALTYRITPRLTFQSSYVHVLETTQKQLSSLQLALDEQNQLVDPITNLPVDITDPGSGLRRKPTRPTGFRRRWSATTSETP